MKVFVFSYLLVLVLSAGAHAQPANYVIILPDDSQADIIRKAAGVVPAVNQLRWQQLEVTAFFHFGINTFTNKEWGDGREDPQWFNPTAFNAQQWIQTVKAAGVKQVLLTAKHHDGFCLWPTTTTAHSVKNSSWKNGTGDVVKEVAQACNANGIGFGVYLSPWDRNAASYGTDAYNDFFVQQLTELLTWYGRIDEVWFDGANGEGPNGKKQVYEFERWYRLIRKLQPNAVIAIMGPDVRWVGTETGYGREQEWSVVPATNIDQSVIAGNAQQGIVIKPMGDLQGDDLGSRDKIKNAKALVWYPAETDVSIRPGWFYHPAENNKVKTPQTLMDIYYNSVGRNGVLLLNIPPDTKGLIHANDSINLLAWKKRLDNTFAKNLAADATIVSVNGLNAQALLDNNDATAWTTKGKDTTAIIEYTLPAIRTFNILLLQENIRKGQRIEQFVLECKNGNTWKHITTGTTVGYKRIIRFPPVTAQQVRLRIVSSRINPVLGTFGLYKEVTE